jgi:hypothetical protein
MFQILEHHRYSLLRKCQLPAWLLTSKALNLIKSVEGMRAVIDGLSHDQNGKFYDYSGREIPW